MTERLRTNPYGSYYYGGPRRASQSSEEPLGTKKTLLVLVVVVGCFAVLWPKVFYPMLVNSANNRIKPSPIDKTTGCCDVISEVDLDTIKIMSELCSTIIDGTEKVPPTPKEIVSQCKKAVLETCGIDISAVLQERVSLGHSVKQILEEVRSLNGSLCLKYNFGVSPWRLGVPHRVHINLNAVNYIRQERPAQLRSDIIHPAFKERGRAIPQPDASLRRSNPPPRIVEGRPGPIPGMRPAMGGPGHVVSPPKQSSNMGILMPIYTIGFVIFFSYTIMKLVFKKKPDTYVGSSLYPPVETDEEFQKEVFEANTDYYRRPSRDSSKIVVNAVSALLEEVNQELEARKIQTAETVNEQDEIKHNGSLPKEEEQGSVTVMGMETTASCEGGKKWSRPDSPVVPQPQAFIQKEPSPPPQQIFLEGSLPPQSQILVSDSAVEAHKDTEEDSPVILAGKMTLSVISLDSETGTEDSSVSGKKTDDEERRTSNGTSEEFEKINAAELEEQINNIIEEAEIIALNDEKRFSLSEELQKFSDEIEKTPQIEEKSKHHDVLEEIKNQFNLEDDLLRALKIEEPSTDIDLPVTDLIKEFLSSEESSLVAGNKEVSEIEKEIADALLSEKIVTELGRVELEPEELLSEEEKELLAKYQELEEAIDDDQTINVKEEDNILDNKQNEVTVIEEQQIGKSIVDLENLATPSSDIEDIKQFILNETEILNGQNGNEKEETNANEERGDETINTLEDKQLSGEEKEALIPENNQIETVVNNEGTEPVADDGQAESALDTQKLEEDINELLNEEEQSTERIYIEQLNVVLDEKAPKDIIEKRNKRQTEEGLISDNKEIDLCSTGEPSLIGRDSANEDIITNQADLLLRGLVVKDDPELELIENVVQIPPSVPEKLYSELVKDDLKPTLTTENLDQIHHSAAEELQSAVVKNDPELQLPENVGQIHPSTTDELNSEIAKDDRKPKLTENIENIHPSTEELKSEVVKVDPEPKLTEDLDQIHPSLAEELHSEEIQRENKNQSNQEEHIEGPVARTEDNVEGDNSKVLDVVEQVIEDVEYLDDSDNDEVLEDEIRQVERSSSEDREARINGIRSIREDVAENEISDNEDLENEDDLEIEEIIEYVDNTDEEGEEIIEINGNQHLHNHQNEA